MKIIKKILILILSLALFLPLSSVFANDDKTYILDEKNKTISLLSEGIAKTRPTAARIDLYTVLSTDKGEYLNDFIDYLATHLDFAITYRVLSPEDAINKKIRYTIHVFNMDKFNDILHDAMNYDDFSNQFSVAFLALNGAPEKIDALIDSGLNTLETTRNIADEILKPFGHKTKDLIAIEELINSGSAYVNFVKFTYEEAKVFNPSDYPVEIRAYTMLTYTY